MKYWKCPYCGWIMNDIAYTQAKADYKCIRCMTPFYKFIFVDEESKK